MEYEIISGDENNDIFDDDKKCIKKNAVKIEGSVQNYFKITKNNTLPEFEIEIIIVRPLHPHKRLLRRKRKCKIKKEEGDDKNNISRKNSKHEIEIASISPVHTRDKLSCLTAAAAAVKMKLKQPFYPRERLCRLAAAIADENIKVKKKIKIKFKRIRNKEEKIP